jgi:hypothetical protein
LSRRRASTRRRTCHCQRTFIFCMYKKEFEGRKIGSELMRCVISQFSLGTRINIVCEGQRRKSLFEKLGFQLLDNDNSSTTTFCMSINLVSLYQT